MLLQKGWSWKPKLAAPVIDFTTLLNEWKEKFNLDSGNLKSLKSTSSQTKTKKGKKIKNLVKSNWLKVAIVSFAFFASSSYDLISDGLLTHSFIGGTIYTKQFANQPDSQLWTFEDKKLMDKAGLDTYENITLTNIKIEGRKYNNLGLLECTTCLQILIN